MSVRSIEFSREDRDRKGSHKRARVRKPRPTTSFAASSSASGRIGCNETATPYRDRYRAKKFATAAEWNAPEAEDGPLGVALYGKALFSMPGVPA